MLVWRCVNTTPRERMNDEEMVYFRVESSVFATHGHMRTAYGFMLAIKLTGRCACNRAQYISRLERKLLETVLVSRTFLTAKLVNHIIKMNFPSLP